MSTTKDEIEKMLHDLANGTEEKESPKVTKTGEDTDTSVVGFNPLTEDAYKWMIEPSIPRAFPPILYCGIDVVYNIFTRIGRPITLEEAQKLVMADGPEIACILNGETFQPVKYTYTCPSDFNGRFEDLPMGGQYYIVDDVLQAVSGSVYFYNSHQDEYVYCNSSPYFILASEGKKKTGQLKWGMTFSKANEILERKSNSRQVRESARKLAGKLFS